MSDQRIFFIADTHFCSDAVRRYENRPFNDTEEMDRFMTDRWNSVVRPDDIVWHLGDFGAEGCEKTGRLQAEREHTLRQGQSRYRKQFILQAGGLSRGLRLSCSVSGLLAVVPRPAIRQREHALREHLRSCAPKPDVPDLRQTSLLRFGGADRLYADFL